MKIIVPLEITEARLTGSNVPETPPAAYDAGTTYALDDEVSVFAGTVATVYRSLQAGNLGNTPAASPVWWFELGTTYAVYDAGTAYAQGDLVVYGHRVYESREAANTGNTPDSSPTKWLDTGATNRYRMFDQVVTSQSTQNGTLVAQITPGEAVNAAAFFNLAGSSIRLQIEDPVAGVVYDQTVDLLDTSDVIDWYSFFFAPVRQLKKAVFLDLPVFLNATFTITIDGGVDTAACGEAVLGYQHIIGDTLFGIGKGITDYSRKETDSFGNTVIVKRRSADRGQFALRVDTSQLDYIDSLLTDLRSTPVVFIGSESRRLTFIYGFYKDWRIVISGPVRSDISIEAEGLT